MPNQEFINAIAKATFGPTLTEAHNKHICVSCGAHIRDERGCEETGENGQIYSDVGWREYARSGLCETCFDSIF